MKLYLLDSNRYMTEAWKKTFQYQNVEIVTGDFQVFIKEYKPEAIVAPGNSFGIMDGGLDLEIRNYFGMKAQEAVSYTHLDVYKRQVMTRWKEQLTDTRRTWQGMIGESLRMAVHSSTADSLITLMGITRNQRQSIAQRT